MNIVFNILIDILLNSLTNIYNIIPIHIYIQSYLFVVYQKKKLNCKAESNNKKIKLNFQQKLN